MMKLDLNAIVEELMETEEMPTFLVPEVSDYVLTHIYEPLLRGETLRFSDLDFDAFGNSDLSDLETMIDARGQMKARLCSLNNTFCKAGAVSVQKRAFC